MRSHFLPSILFLLGLFTTLGASAQSAGDTITVENKKFVLLNNNIVVNPGFENGFTGWTDATSSFCDTYLY